jgi:hypothetical protein
MFKWYREPLVHFILIASIFSFFIGKKSPSSNRLPTESKKVIVTEQKVQELRQKWKHLQGKEPSSTELNNSIEKYIQNEILYQEALRLKLDRDDPLIREVLIDKMHYIFSDFIDIKKISETRMKAYFKKHANRFVQKKRVISFEQIYLNPQKHQSIESLADSIWGQVHQKPYNASTAKLGDEFYGGNQFMNVNSDALGEFFSHAFIEKLFTLKEKSWSKPLKSGFGIHLIYLEKRIETQELEYATFKKEIEIDVLLEERKKAYQKFYNELRKEYEVVWK